MVKIMDAPLLMEMMMMMEMMEMMSRMIIIMMSMEILLFILTLGAWSIEYRKQKRFVIGQNGAISVYKSVKR